jgi:uncharacterized protein GlcG (DUF336 family)
MTAPSLRQASFLIEAIMAIGRRRALQPLTVAVLDSGGHLVALQRDDGASFLRPQIAIGKAYGALSLGVTSRKIGEMAVERPWFVDAVKSLAPFGLIPAAGGVIIHDGEGRVVGAVGVTGDTSDNDEVCALEALSTLNLDEPV